MSSSFNVTLQMDPPTTTHQRKCIVTIPGRGPIMVDHKDLKRASATYDTSLIINRLSKPAAPLAGALSIAVSFNFQTKNAKRWGKMKTTKPDLDNMQKGLFDALARNGWIESDQIICLVTAAKWWTPRGSILVQCTEVE